MCARNKHLIVNTSKSEVVHFNSAGENAPVFNVGGATLHHKDSCTIPTRRYPGMVFYSTLNMTLNMAKSAEHASHPFWRSPSHGAQPLGPVHTRARRPAQRTPRPQNLQGTLD